MKNVSILALAFLAAGHGAWAQPAVSAGAQLQQIPPPPVQPRSTPDIRIERGRAPAPPGPPGERFVVKSLRVTGATRFSEAVLIAAAHFKPGEALDLAGLRAMAARISDFYTAHGYFVAQAYVPAQDIADGSVTIAVLEGRYGKVELKDRAPVSDRLALSILAGLKPGDVISSPPLERRLLLLSDLPDVTVKSTLSPGEAVGTSDLDVNLTPGRRVTGDVEVDNAGNPYTGEYRGGGAVNFNEVTGHGDTATVRVLTSGSGLIYVRGDYEARIQDATVGVAYAHLGYQLGGRYEALDANGTADTASVYASYPLIRSQNTNLYALADFDYRTFRDNIGATDSRTDRAAEVVILGLAGDHHDGLWGGGWTSYSVHWAAGDLDIRTPLARSIDAVTARSNGGYGKFSFEVARLQSFGASPFSLYGEVRGQLASKNLDSSEKMELGGAYGVRAYPEGEAYGDQGYIATLEARLKLAALSRPTHGDVQALVFVDNGSVTLNRSPWAAGSNSRTLSAAGVGLTWADRHGLAARVSYAFELGDEPALSAPDHGGRLWFQISKNF
jgi:hemolysin activation/secretion protein